MSTGLWQELGPVIVSWALQLVGAGAVLVLGWMSAKWIRRSVRRGLERTEVEPTLVSFVASGTYYLILVFVAVAVLNLFGVQTASLVVALGAAGIAVGMALQGTLSNFSSGVMLLLFRPFHVGDYVEAAGVAGNVEEIGIFQTRLSTTDNVRVVVPNSMIYGDVVRNYSANERRRIDLVVGIGYGDDIGVALDAIRSVLAAEDRLLDEPEPTVAVDGLGDSAVQLVVRPWCRTEDYWSVRRDLVRALKEGLEAAGCQLPYPQRDVHLHREESGG